MMQFKMRKEMKLAVSVTSYANSAKRLLIGAGILVLLTASTVITNAQAGAVISGQVVNLQGVPQPYATVRICTQTASGIPCTPLASIFSDPGLTVPLSNPFSVNQYGFYSVFVGMNTSFYQVQTTYGSTTYPFWENGAFGGGAYCPLTGCLFTGPVTIPTLTLTNSLTTLNGGTGATTAQGAATNIVDGHAINPLTIGVTTPVTSINAGTVAATGTVSGSNLTSGGHASADLPLSGGTLTGPLSGTSASFSGNVSAGLGVTTSIGTSGITFPDSTVQSTTGFNLCPGTYGDNSHDDSVALSACGAVTNGHWDLLPNHTYKVTNFTITASGVIFDGHSRGGNNSNPTTIKQYGGTGNGITIDCTPAQCEPDPALRGFNITSNTDSTGFGISMTGAGDHLEISDVNINGFAQSLVSVGHGQGYIWNMRVGSATTSCATLSLACSLVEIGGSSANSWVGFLGGGNKGGGPQYVYSLLGLGTGVGNVYTIGDVGYTITPVLFGDPTGSGFTSSEVFIQNAEGTTGPMARAFNGGVEAVHFIGNQGTYAPPTTEFSTSIAIMDLYNPPQVASGTAVLCQSTLSGACRVVPGTTRTLNNSSLVQDLVSGETAYGNLDSYVLDNAINSPTAYTRGQAVRVIGRAGIADDQFLRYYRLKDGTNKYMNLLLPTYASDMWNLFGSQGTAASDGSSNFKSAKPCWAASIGLGSSVGTPSICATLQPGTGANPNLTFTWQAYPSGTGKIKWNLYNFESTFQHIGGNTNMGAGNLAIGTNYGTGAGPGISGTDISGTITLASVGSTPGQQLVVTFPNVYSAVPKLCSVQQQGETTWYGYSAVCTTTTMTISVAGTLPDGNHTLTYVVML
jgi:hypothetical protein